ncbi:MAG: glycosyl hydrolase family 18 protein [Candidatus Krumholzibacteria bacterium]|nr:glycosyl hydrolase family 18 protein [Candidatus Krumholzibacteria bacterium]MDP6796753.1 glycosyl hydrolase family 18 protein [Candidatus Krumholzibacteria bacterium]MDP7021693.1 glycosyl hydrolase family 18 protein [Candidatus Krumholzibacteria bacterium]
MLLPTQVLLADFGEFEDGSDKSHHQPGSAISFKSSSPAVFGYVETLYGDLSAGKIDYRPYTHIVDCFLIPDSWGNTESAHGLPRKSLIEAAHSAGCRVLLSLGGGSVSGEVFSDIVARKRTRDRFVREICDLAASAGYDGLDIDWEFPRGEERHRFVTLVKAFREEIDRGVWRDASGGRPLLTIGISPGYWLRGYDFEALDPMIDYGLLFGYDHRNPALGPWMHWKDLWPEGEETPIEGSVSGVAAELLQRGLSRSKLVIGFPFYSSAGKPWIHIRDKVKESNAPLHPLYLEKKVDGQWVTDEEGLREKVSSALNGHDVQGGAVAGVAVWQIGHQGLKQDLSEALLDALAY